MTAPPQNDPNQSVPPPPPPPYTPKCVVCYETFAENDDRSSFSRSCPSCDQPVCFACFETHQRVTGRGLHDVRCVSCNEPWPDRDLYAWLQQHPGAEARFAHHHGTLHHLRAVENTYMAETHKLMRYEDDVHTVKRVAYEARSREVADLEHALRIARYAPPPSSQPPSPPPPPPPPRQTLRLRLRVRQKELRQLGDHIQAWQTERRVLFADLARKHRIAAFLREDRRRDRSPHTTDDVEHSDDDDDENAGRFDLRAMCAHPDCAGRTVPNENDDHHDHDEDRHTTCRTCTLCERPTCARCGEAVVVSASDTSSSSTQPPKKHTTKRHVCHDDTRHTFEAMYRTTKPCPRCTVPIEKSYGCDQMWCTRCHFAFCWSTGKPLNPNAQGFHNEHHAAHVAATTTTLTTDDFRHLRAEILALCHHSSHHLSVRGYALYGILESIQHLDVVVAHTLANHLADLRDVPFGWMVTTIANTPAPHSDNSPEHVWRQQHRFRRNWVSRTRLIRGTITSEQFDTHLVRQHKRDRFFRTLRTLCLTTQKGLVDVVRGHLLRLFSSDTTVFENNDHDNEVRSSLRESIARFDHTVHETERAFRLKRPAVVIRWFTRAQRVLL